MSGIKDLSFRILRYRHSDAFGELMHIRFEGTYEGRRVFYEGFFPSQMPVLTLTEIGVAKMVSFAESEDQQ